jgi:hypothetical protein
MFPESNISYFQESRVCGFAIYVLMCGTVNVYSAIFTIYDSQNPSRSTPCDSSSKAPEGGGIRTKVRTRFYYETFE